MRFKVSKRPQKVNKLIAKYFYAARVNNDPVWKWMAPELIMQGHMNFWGANNKNTQGAGIHVCVMDSGIDYNSPFFKDSTVIDNKTSRSFVNSPWTKDIYYHGHFVASQIYHKFSLAEVINGNEIICCGCPSLSRMTILKVINDDGSASMETISDGLNYLLSLPEQDLPHIVNCSFSASPDYATTLIGKRICLQLDALKERGVIICCAAGNHKDGANDSIRFFANYHTTNAITATTATFGPRVSWSCMGQEATWAMDGSSRLGARTGTKIEYGKCDGTSMACPDATSFLALCLSFMSKGETGKVRELIKERKYIDFLKKNNLVYDLGAPGRDNDTGDGTLYLRENHVLQI